jgi:hypothetical protein
MFDGGWVIRGQNPIDLLSCRQLNRAVRAAAVAGNSTRQASLRTAYC